MERLRERIQQAYKALRAFSEVAQLKAPTTIERDAAIQRFEFTFEVCWKTGKHFLYVVEGLDIGSPKGVIRTSREVGIFSDEETIQALKMVNDRNLTVHTYNEELAVEIYNHLKAYYILLDKWIKKIEKRIEDTA